MDLILWRHAEAEDGHEGLDDMNRALTARGEKQAQRMTGWLRQHLPRDTRIVASPALRCVQTVQSLGHKYKLAEQIAPGALPQDLLAAAEWPLAPRPVLLVGHQPTLGGAIAQLLQIAPGGCAVRKGAVWWLRTRERDGQQQTVVWTVQSPELL